MTDDLRATLADATSAARFRFGPFELNRAERRLLRSGVPLAVAPRAFDVLALLVERAGSLVTKSDLLEHVWPRAVVEANAVQSQVSALRKCLGPEAITTVSGHGYRFELEVTEVGAAPPATRPTTSNNLPLPLTSFIGREAEVGQLKQALAQNRLLSLVGAGGCGKSRLALRLAGELLGACPDGVWLVELAPLTAPGLVAGSLASVLGLKEEPGRPLLQTIATHLGRSRSMILLDNAEHLIDAVAALAETILRQCPEVRVLVTSRERPAVIGGSTYRVPSLPTPAPARSLTAAALVDHAAIRLFVERVRLHCPQFAVTDGNAAALASICHRLDGMPLAIELAAPLLRAMSVDEIDRRLDRSFALLAGGPRSALHRQRTLRATIDWSHDLLGDAERCLLRRLAVFAGGWTLDAAEAICAGGSLEAHGVAELLVALADKSLIAADETRGATRFTMLQSVREYAVERLAESGEAQTWQRRHLDHFLALAETSTPKLMVVNPAVIECLETEYANLRAAIDRSSTIGTTGQALRLSAALFRFWAWTGRWGEGLAALSQALETARGPDDRAARARALNAAAVFAGRRGDYAGAGALCEQAIGIDRELGDMAALASTLVGRGILNYDQGRYDAARADQTEALAILRRLGESTAVRAALNNLANVAGELGDFAQARACHEECLSMARDAGDHWGTAVSLLNLGVILSYQGELTAARERCEASLLILRETGEPRSVALCLDTLSAIRFEQGDHETARAMLVESLSTLARLGDRLSVVAAIESSAGLLAREHLADAVRLWGAAERLREQGGVPSSPVTTARREARVTKARLAMADPMLFEQCWNAGRSMDLAHLVPHALALLAPHLPP